MARGIDDARVIAAMRAVRRERFVAADLSEFAYADSPLPIGSGQTISQPYIVALMAMEAEIGPDDRVLEVGTGSGYGAAVLAHLAAEVWTIERHRELAEVAAARLREGSYDNVHVVVGDGTLGWPEEAPFDAIIVTASGPDVPAALQDQLVVDGGRLVLPIGPDTRTQSLLRVRRVGNDFVREDLGAVRFVPLIGEQGWSPTTADPGAGPHPAPAPVPAEPVTGPSPAAGRSDGIGQLIVEGAEPFPSFDEVPFDALLDRVGESDVVLLGEASHGSSEFYEMRDRITRELILKKGFVAVAVEADWPDAAAVDAYVRGRLQPPPPFRPFSRFPTWMWRNEEVASFIGWLRAHNQQTTDVDDKVSFHGLDIYSLFRSRDVVLAFLDRVDPEAAAAARERYSCLSPWEHDPSAYGRAVALGALSGCEDEVVAVLTDLLMRRFDYAAAADDRVMDAAQNALIVSQAERYYRLMYRGSATSWNLRDQHMFETLELIRRHRGPEAKVIVWEHNAHVGDASATEMGARGEQNVGQLARRSYGESVYLVGFGTDHGVVAAASTWGGPLEHKLVRPSHSESYERLFHDSGIEALLLPLRHPLRPQVAEELAAPRLERAIGVIYRPETELQSHYFQASLANQFDEYVWFDRTTAVTALRTALW